MKQPWRAAPGVAVVAIAAMSNASAPQLQYELFNKSSVEIHDSWTGLYWQRVLSSQPATFTFADAITYCGSLQLGSHNTGWRVPSYKELLTLVDDSPHTDFMTGLPVVEAIDGNAFPSTPPAPFWTSSFYQSASTGRAWTVSFADGVTFDLQTTTSTYVRCVHD